MKTETSRNTFSRNHSGPSPSSQKKCQPPRKSVVASAERTIMLMYSAIENRPQRIPPYSVWYPATSSDSASGRSNGARADSAVPAVRKTRKPTNCGTTNQIVSSCLATISVSRSDSPMITTPSTESASATSYETSCAHVRIEPSSEYFDSEAQPPTMKP